ncbi:DUF3152 domain-containing protein [Streptomyces sp. NPDC051940]|uniref:DUF3152 domain-containing protein n=1 Tax=Streptomyces sp. NPDC051940 TaxID=3155675 RepID=UPI003432B604
MRRVAMPVPDFGLITHAAAYPSEEVRGGHPPYAEPPARPRPRAEYVGAFDEDVYGGIAAPPGPRGGDDWADWPAGLRDGEPRPEPVQILDGGRAGRRRSRVRRVTGIAAALTAVAVTAGIAVQAVDGGGADEDRTAAGERAGSDRATRSQPREEPQTAQQSPAAAPAPPTYAEAMAARYPLAADLSGPDEFYVAGAPAKAPGKGRVVKYRVDVERGLPLDGELFAEAVHKTLNDRRSWGGTGERTFQRVGAGEDAAFVITLASPGTTNKWCAKVGLNTAVQKVSCDAHSTPRVMINAYRWARGAETFGDHMLAYRQMVINHEVGHRLGWGHVGCDKDGGLAPVMMQQTKFLSTDGRTCRPNPWPYPTR